MALVYLNRARVVRVPEQRVLVNGVHAPELVCETVAYSKDGGIATFSAPTLLFDDDKSGYLRNLITVYARNDGESWGAPLFVGAVDSPTSQLRGEQVTFEAKSLYWWLRREEWKVPTKYDVAHDGLMTGNLKTVFAAGAKYSFPIENPYIPNSYFDGKNKWLWQPTDILAAFMADLQPVWATRGSYGFDPSLPHLEALAVKEAKLYWDETNGVYALPVTRHISPIGDQMFRAQNFGSIIDLTVELFPACEVCETYDDTGRLVLVFINPSSLPPVTVTVGTDGEDLRDCGADVEELNVGSSAHESCNRVVGFGAPACCITTVMSEEVDEDGNLVGLVPDWPAFEMDAAPEEYPQGMPGFSAYDAATGAYALTSDVTPQPIIIALRNPDVTDTKSPAYITGYEIVGKRWRLPNWFVDCEIEKVKGYLDGNQPFQVWVELACNVSTTEGGVVLYKYDWFRWDDGAALDSKTRTLTLEKLPVTRFIGTPDETNGCTVLDETCWKLARIAVTFAWSNPARTLCEDTGINRYGTPLQPDGTNTNVLVCDPSLVTAIGHHTFVVNRPDLRFEMLTNTFLNIEQWHDEIVPDEDDAALGITSVYQFRRHEKRWAYYPKLLLSVVVDGVEREWKAVSTSQEIAAPGAYYVTGQRVDYANRPIRNDVGVLRGVVLQQYASRAARVRRFSASLLWLNRAIWRCLPVVFRNLGAGYEPGNDRVDTLTHDLRAGQTRFTTCNVSPSKFGTQEVGRFDV